MKRWVKDDMFKEYKRGYKVVPKKLNIIMSEIASVTGLHKWVQNKTVEVVDSPSYQDVDVYDTFSIRMVKETGETRIYFKTLGEMYNTLRSSEEFPEYFATIKKFIAKFEETVALRWNESEIAKCESYSWIAGFHQRLLNEFDVLFNLETQTFYVKETDTEIKIERVLNQDLQQIIEEDNRFVIKQYYMKETKVEHLELLLRENEVFEKLRSRLLSSAFEKGINYEGINYDLFIKKVTKDKSKAFVNRMMKNIEKKIPNELFDILFTLAKKGITVKQPFYSFRVEYYKCDAGYLCISIEDKKVIYMKSEDELVTYCLNSIYSQHKQIVNYDIEY
ncbi:hypothetical protein [Bacillus sp. Brlt_9]|uniref:hypothetical protein n=1 Tax=Bacillus sp. Brlt_9 TaxID=3110916 RepID=UPI003F7BA64A